MSRQISPGEGRVLSVQQWGASPALLLYATQRGGVHAMDLRAGRDVWVAPAPPRLGLLQQVRPRATMPSPAGPCAAGRRTLRRAPSPAGCSPTAATPHASPPPRLVLPPFPPPPAPLTAPMPRLPPPPPRQVVVDPLAQHWLLLATHRGELRLWDVRFMLRAAGWRHPAG